MSMTIYERSTGAAIVCENVDAREILASAPELYSDKPVEVAAPSPVAEASTALADHTVVELKALAVERGVDLGDAVKKADIVAALELAAEAAEA